MAEVDLLIKLFETLKDALRDTNQLCQAMLNNQTSIANHMKTLPIEDLKQVLKDHSKESSDDLKDHSKESSDDIGTCTETVETQGVNILNEIRDLKGKVKTMIIVVVVAFTLFSSVLLVGKLMVDTDQTHEELKIEIIRELNKKRSEKVK